MGRPYHKIEFKNQTYKLRLNTWGAWVLDKEHGFRFTKIDENNFEIPEMMLIIYASLFDFHEDKATLKFASQILDEMGFKKALKLVSNLAFDYMPQAEPDEEATKDEEVEGEEGKKTEEFGSPPGMNS